MDISNVSGFWHNKPSSVPNQTNDVFSEGKMDLEDFSKTELIDLIKKIRSRKQYGIVWEEEKTRENLEKDGVQFLPVLTEIKKKRISTVKIGISTMQNFKKFS
jgi:hypothetical protein